MLLDLIVLLALMFVFARHEAEWEPTSARSGIYFWYLNPKAVLIFLPQFTLCRFLMGQFWGYGQILILLLFFLPLAPLLHRFFYVPWRKAFIISGCFLIYMIIVAAGIYRERAEEAKSRPGDGLEQFLPQAEDTPASDRLTTPDTSPRKQAGKASGHFRPDTSPEISPNQAPSSWC